MGWLSQEEEIEILQSLLVSYEYSGELTLVIETRQKLLDKPLVKKEKNLFASLLRALAIDYSKQENWSQYKQLRLEAAMVFRKNNNIKESAGEYMFFWEQKDQTSLNRCLEITSFICKKTGNSEALFSGSKWRVYL